MLHFQQLPEWHENSLRMEKPLLFNPAFSTSLLHSQFSNFQETSSYAEVGLAHDVSNIIVFWGLQMSVCTKIIIPGHVVHHMFM